MGHWIFGQRRALPGHGVTNLQTKVRLDAKHAQTVALQQ